MSEAEILDRMFDVINSVMTIFSIFFSLVSGYLAALYLFLNRAPLLLRLVAFGLLSTGMCFLGGTAAVIQRLQDGLFAAWDRLEKPSIALATVRNPLPTSLSSMLPVTQQEIGVAIGWTVAIAVYLVLAYLTFVYTWPAQSGIARE